MIMLTHFSEWIFNSMRYAGYLLDEIDNSYSCLLIDWEIGCGIEIFIAI